MKKFLYIFVILILIISLILFGVPLLFQGKITEAVKTEINNNLNAKVEFSDLSLSFIHDFPNFTLEIENMSVVNNEPFAGDTLVSFSSLLFNLDLFSVFMGDKISIKRIEINKMNFLAKVLENGKANWDITIETEQEETSDEGDSDGFVISLKDFRIIQSNIIYIDNEMDMVVDIKNMNAGMKGDLSASLSKLKITTDIESLNYDYEGMRYLNSTKVDFTGKIDADLDNFAFTFLKNQLLLNQFPIVFEGSIAMPKDDITMDISFATPETNPIAIGFKNFLSLIPAIYMNDYKNMETIGKLSFNGFVKGLYNENSIPGFDINLLIDRALFKYPDLPKSAENINVDINLNNPGGDADFTKIIVNKFHVDLGQNSFDMKMKIENPVSDAKINGEINSNIIFESLSDIIPLQDLTIKGNMLANLKMMGVVSDIENEEYYKFACNGRLELNNFEYNDKDMPNQLNIKNLNLTFSPKFLNLNTVIASIGSSDFQLNGKIGNYLLWFFKDEMLTGNLKMSSNILNLNELMASDNEATTTTSTEDTASISPVEIPKNINFTFVSSINKIYYNKLNIDKLNGIITIKDGKLEMKNTSMDMLGGSLLLNGFYNAQDINNPAIDFSMDILNFDIPSTYSSFNTIKEIAPLAKYSNGKISASLSINSILDNKMKPVLSTINSEGGFSSNEIKIISSPIFNKVADKLKVAALSKPELKNINVKYVMENGTITIEPFTTNIAGYPAKISGNQGIDQTIDYTIALEIPRKALGSSLNSIIPTVVDNYIGNKLNIDVFLKGSFNDPSVSLGMGKTSGKIIDNVKESAKVKVDETKEKLKEEANKKAQKLLEEAQKQANAVKKTARQAADKIKAEADKKAKEIINAAKNKSFIEKKLAKKAADEIKKEANKKANNVIVEADKKADEIMKKAKSNSKI